MPQHKKNYISIIKNKVGKQFNILKIYNNSNRSRDKKIKIKHNNQKCNYHIFTKSIRCFIKHPICPLCNKIKNKKCFHNFKILNFYKSSTPTVFKCSKGHIFKQTLNEFEKHPYCPKCIKINKAKKFDNQLQKITNNKYIRIGKFTGIDNKTIILHKKCKYKWHVPPIRLYEGYRCPFCQHKLSIKQTFHFKFDKKFSKNWLLVSKIKNDNSLITLKCKKCNHKIKITPHNLFEQGILCPFCNGFRSKGEKYTYHYLIKHNINNFIYGYILKTKNIPTIKGNLHLDFYIPKLRIAIEYDGYQHFHPITFFGGNKNFKKQRWNDLIKDYYCKNHNIKLIRIENIKNYSSIKKIKYLIKTILNKNLLPLINNTWKTSFRDFVF